MKLRNKLLPIAALSSVATVVAPMIASCSLTTTQDIQNYKSNVKQHDFVSSPWTDTYAGEYYFENANLAEIFKDDAFYWMSKEIKIGNAEDEVKINALKAGVDGVKAVKNTTTPTSAYLFSYVLALDLDFEYTTTKFGGNYNFALAAQIEFKVDSMPYIIQNSGGTSGSYDWRIKPYYNGDEVDFELWNKMSPSWAMAAGLSGKVKLNNVGLDLNTSAQFNNSSTDEEKILFTSLANILRKMESHHLAQVKGTAN